MTVTSQNVELLQMSSNEFEALAREQAGDTGRGVASAATETVELKPRRLRRAKKAYTVRHFAEQTRADGCEGYQLIRGREVHPQVGDLVLARVATIGQHKRLESFNSRRRNLFVGDEIVVAYGNRYAPDQFLASVPRNLDFTNLVAAGGLAGEVVDKHAGMSPATVIEPIGLIADSQGVINLQRTASARIRPWRTARDEFRAAPRRPKLVVVFGSSMNSGKTTCLGCLVNGLDHAGLEVAAGKATGTGAGNDAGLFRDAGAATVLDFTDFGVPSTYLMSFEDLKDLVFSTFAELAAQGVDAVVVEIADGVYQGETAQLVSDPDLVGLVDSVLFACGEALSAAAGSTVLTAAGLPLSAVTGKLTSSPLISQEAQEVCVVPVIPTYDLCLPEVACRVIGR